LKALSGRALSAALFVKARPAQGFNSPRLSGFRVHALGRARRWMSSDEGSASILSALQWRIK
jgi:hypothetical protein